MQSSSGGIEPVKTTATQCLWGEIADGLAGSRDELEPFLAAMERFRDEDMVRVAAPYGTQLISDGRFEWSLAPELHKLRQAYGDTAIPLGLVLSKSVELSTQIAFAGGNSRHVNRTIPAYLITRGELFGLFENVARDLKQDALNGFAGGVTLLVLPPLGREAEIAAFATSIKWTCPSALRENIKPTRNSAWNFGGFFAGVLEAVKCEWRIEMAIFPKPVLDRILADSEVSLCLHRLALRQLSVAHERVLSVMAMVSSASRKHQEDVISIRQVERGNRPGFAPVLGTALDEEVLPARELLKQLHAKPHGLFSDWEDLLPDGDAPAKREPGSLNDYFPAIFRPSLPREPFFYFLRRPFAFQAEREITIEQRARDVADDLKSADPGLRFELFLDPRGLEKVLLQQCVGVERINALEIHLSESQFLDAGVIRVEPRRKRADTL
jgi:hypothetical protein